MKKMCNAALLLCLAVILGTFNITGNLNAFATSDKQQILNSATQRAGENSTKIVEACKSIDNMVEKFHRTGCRNNAANVRERCGR